MWDWGVHALHDQVLASDTMPSFLRRLLPHGLQHCSAMAIRQMSMECELCRQQGGSGGGSNTCKLSLPLWIGSSDWYFITRGPC